MRRFTQTLVFGLVMSLLAVPPLSAQDEVPWLTDLDQAFEVAKQQNRPLLVHFWSPDCIPCLQLEESVFSHPSVSRTMGDLFVPVKINAKDQPRIAAQYKIRSVPWDVILTPAGNELHRMLSPQDPQRYVAQLSAAAFKSGAPDRRQVARPAQASTTGYHSALGPPPGGSHWSDEVMKRQRLGKSVAPIGADALGPEPASKPQPLVGEPEEVINRFAQKNSSASRPAPRSEVTPRSAAVARGEWGTWPDDASASETPAGDVISNQPEQGRFDEVPEVRPRRNTRPDRGPGEKAVTRRKIAPLAMDGFCPVTLLKKDKWTKGDKRFGVVHRGRTYLFVGAEEKEAFFKNPDDFSPILAGIDPVLLADSGEAVEGQRAFGVVYRKRVFLFTTEENLQRFWQQPEAYADPVRQAMQSGTVGRLFR